MTAAIKDLPLADATPVVAPNVRVYTRVHTKLVVAIRAARLEAVAARLAAPVVADLRGWWLLAAAPTTLTAWLAGQSPAARRVPADNRLLRAAWITHNWTLGLLAAALSVVLFLAGGALRWLACHPVRLWSALFIGAATTVALLYL